MSRIGIDLGGTKIEIIALDDNGGVLLRRRVATPQGDYLGTISEIVRLIGSAEQELGYCCSVGIGIPGAESVGTGLVKNANSTCLIGHALRADLEGRLQRDIRVANDANCFALSEAIDGSGRGASVVFGAILGTGVGGGIVVQQQVVTGANRIAGEWGHNSLPNPHEEESSPVFCYCGRSGCIESWLSGPGLIADHRRNGGDVQNVEEIVTLAAQGDPLCVASLERYERRLAKALALVINILDPDVIVLGGGLSNIGQLYDRVPTLWSEYVFSDHVETRLVRPQHGDSSGVRGAAWLWHGA